MPSQRTPMREISENRPKGKHLTPYMRGKIAGCRLFSSSPAEIAIGLNIRLPTVRYTLSVDHLHYESSTQSKDPRRKSYSLTEKRKLFRHYLYLRLRCRQFGHCLLTQEGIPNNQSPPCAELLFTPPRTPLKPCYAANSDPETIIAPRTINLANISAENIPASDIVSPINVGNNDLPYSQSITLTTPSLHLQLDRLFIALDFVQVLSGHLSTTHAGDAVRGREYSIVIVNVEDIPTTTELRLSCPLGSNELTIQLQNAWKGIICIAFVWDGPLTDGHVTNAKTCFYFIILRFTIRPGTEPQLRRCCWRSLSSDKLTAPGPAAEAEAKTEFAAQGAGEMEEETLFVDEMPTAANGSERRRDGEGELNDKVNADGLATGEETRRDAQIFEGAASHQISDDDNGLEIA
ncbi:hypothetical protein BDZ45DRAFT_812194 [Acephala macrosclerotiorum]|nr:hypothetical protein BDZ45DRAFT_812194 [Acephala macrosclerotiorum]